MTIADEIRRLDEQRARHVERMHEIMGGLRDDFELSRERETFAEKLSRGANIVRCERLFQADVTKQILGVHGKLAASAADYLCLREELVVTN